jgi:hypothetical protein
LGTQNNCRNCATLRSFDLENQDQKIAACRNSYLFRLGAAPKTTVGAKLARDGGVSVNVDVE